MSLLSLVHVLGLKSCPPLSSAVFGLQERAPKAFVVGLRECPKVKVSFAFRFARSCGLRLRAFVGLRKCPTMKVSFVIRFARSCGLRFHALARLRECPTMKVSFAISFCESCGLRFRVFVGVRVPEDEGVVRCSLCDVLWVQVSCVCRVVRAPKG